MRMRVHFYFERREWHKIVGRDPGKQNRRHHIHSTALALTARIFSTTPSTEGPSMRQTSSAFLWELSVAFDPPTKAIRLSKTSAFLCM